MKSKSVIHGDVIKFYNFGCEKIKEVNVSSKVSEKKLIIFFISQEAMDATRNFLENEDALYETMTCKPKTLEMTAAETNIKLLVKTIKDSTKASNISQLIILSHRKIILISQPNQRDEIFQWLKDRPISANNQVIKSEKSEDTIEIICLSTEVKTYFEAFAEKSSALKNNLPSIWPAFDNEILQTLPLSYAVEVGLKKENNWLAAQADELSVSVVYEPLSQLVTYYYQRFEANPNKTLEEWEELKKAFSKISKQSPFYSEAHKNLFHLTLLKPACKKNQEEWVPYMKTLIFHAFEAGMTEAVQGLAQELAGESSLAENACFNDFLKQPTDVLVSAIIYKKELAEATQKQKKLEEEIAKLQAQTSQLTQQHLKLLTAYEQLERVSDATMRSNDRLSDTKKQEAPKKSFFK